MKKRSHYGNKREGGEGKSYPKRERDPRSKSGDFDNKGKDSYRGESHGRSKSRDFDNDRNNDDRRNSRYSRGTDNDRPRSRGNGNERTFRSRADRDRNRSRDRFYDEDRRDNDRPRDNDRRFSDRNRDNSSRGGYNNSRSSSDRRDDRSSRDFRNDRSDDRRRPRDFGNDRPRSRDFGNDRSRGFDNDRNRDDRRDDRRSPRNFGNDRPRFDKRRSNDGEERENPKSRFERKRPNHYTNNKVGLRDRPDYDGAIGKKSFNRRNDDKPVSDEIRLNRYISNSGVCSRREADELIANGQVKVNGEVVSEMGFKVKKTDKVVYKGKQLSREKPVYILLNKPKGFITTTNDPEGRKTVMDLLQGACEERVYPVGRLDRDTTGLLLLTNDGQLAKDLAHPSGNTRKIYNVELDRPIAEADFEVIVKRKLILEDGPVDLDGISIINTEKTQLGVELHSGKNRIVRRIFEHFGYKIMKLDRTVYAGLTKIDLQRGNWRFLSEKELVRMKHMNIRK